MDMKRMREIAGIPVEDTTPLYESLMEVVQLPDDLTLEDLVSRMDHCKKALSLCSRLKDPADKKKWLSATMVNMNKVRGALNRMIKKLDAQQQSVAPIATSPAPAAPGLQRPGLDAVA